MPPSRGALCTAVSQAVLVGISFGVVLPSLQRFLQAQRSVGGLEAPAGLFSTAVALYSVGEAAGAAAFGRAYDARRASAASVLSAALLVFIAGNVVYASAAAAVVAVCARVGVGLYTGGANAVLRAWATRSTTATERAGVMAMLPAAATLAIAVGPLVGALLTLMQPIEWAGGAVRIDEFRAPGWLLALLGLASVPAVCITMRNDAVKDKGAGPIPTETVKVAVGDGDSGAHEATPLVGAVNSSDGSANAPDTTRARRLWAALSGNGGAMGILLFLFFCNSLAFSVVETMATLIAGDQLGWSVRATGHVLIASGGAAVVALAVYVKLSRSVQDRALVASGFVLLFLAVLSLADVQSLVGSAAGEHGGDACLAWSGTSAAQCAAATGGRCVWMRDNCDTCSPYCRNPARTLAPWQFVTSLVLLNGGGMLGRTAVTVLYSKLLTSSPRVARDAGALMAMLVMTGSVARIAAPYVAVAAYTAAGHRTYGLALGLAGLFGLTGVGVCSAYARLVVKGA